MTSYREGVRHAAADTGDELKFKTRDLYNLLNANNGQKLQGKTTAELLLEQVEEDEVIHVIETDEQMHIVRLFTADRKMLPLLKPCYEILLFDCTYKTNKFKMPLLNIVAASAMNSTIQVA
ncbi:hypothetical protein E4U58_005108, partial [Claviceps cyperi]